MKGDGHILLIDDDQDLTRLITRYLSENGFSVDVLLSGEDAVEKILTIQPSLVLLDLMLPGEGGFSICRRIREYFDRPILMLTALADDIDQVAGLEMGADDYVTKPVNPRVLLSRIRVLLRLYQRKIDESSACEGSKNDEYSEPIVIDPTTREVFIGKELLDLTTLEFDLIYYFSLYEGVVLSRERLYQAIYKRRYDGLDRGLDLLVSRLRKKTQCNRLIKTIRGQGYLYSGKWLENY